jgi:hypothetical protein
MPLMPDGVAVGRMVHYFAKGSFPADEELPTDQEQVGDGGRAGGAPLMAWIAEVNLQSLTVDLVYAKVGDQLGEWGPARGVEYSVMPQEGCWSWPQRK